jgi:hypothetical protein
VANTYVGLLVTLQKNLLTQNGIGCQNAEKHRHYPYAMGTSNLIELSLLSGN